MIQKESLFKRKRGEKISGLIAAMVLVLLLCPSCQSAPLTNGDFILEQNDEGLWGYVNLKGKILIPHQYNSAERFISGAAMVQNQEGYYGFINFEGNPTTPFDLVYIGSFDENNYAIAENSEGKFGFVNQNGVVIPCIYDEVSAFNDRNIAQVRLGEDFYSSSFGVINRYGTEIVSLTSKDYILFPDIIFICNQNDKWGAVNYSGNTIFEDQFLERPSFNESLGAPNYGGELSEESVSMVSVEGTEGQILYGVITMDGKTVLPCEYLYIDPYPYNNISLVQNSQGLWGLHDFNANGEIVMDYSGGSNINMVQNSGATLKCEYTEAVSSGEMVYFKNSAGKWAFFDMSTLIKSDFIYDSPEAAEQGYR